MSGHQPKTPEGQAELESACVEPLSNLDLSLLFLTIRFATGQCWDVASTYRGQECAPDRGQTSVVREPGQHYAQCGPLVRGPKSSGNT